MKKTICFDMDGTIADFYGVENWLDYLKSENPYPYMIAKPLVNMSALARILNNRQKKGYKLVIISWLSKTGSENFNSLVTEAKMLWLKKHLPSVVWDEIHILPYGTPKENYGDGILFDDEKPNRDNWGGTAYDVNNILEILKKL